MISEILRLEEEIRNERFNWLEFNSRFGLTQTVSKFDVISNGKNESESTLNESEI